MSKPTVHGRNIARQIQNEDAYGFGPGKMTMADIYLILDNIHTHFMDTDQDTSLLEKWLHELEMLDEDLPCS